MYFKTEQPLCFSVGSQSQQFREDNQSKRNQTATENANLIAKLVNTMLEQEKIFLKSKKRKRLKAFVYNT